MDRIGAIGNLLVNALLFHSPMLQKFALKIFRGARIRTEDPLLPKQVRYQAALHPE